MEKLHVYDWLETPTEENHPNREGIFYAKRWLHEFTKPAMFKNNAWLAKSPLFVEYKGEKYRCTGASRMGDVWLASNLATEYGYDKRVDVEDCYNWSASMQPASSEETLVLFTSEQLGLKLGCVVEITKQFWLSVYTEAGTRRQGLASSTIKEACAYADNLKVNLNLAVYGDETVRWGNAEGITQNLLVNWYSKFGFIVVNRTLDDKVHMTRFPR